MRLGELLQASGVGEGVRALGSRDAWSDVRVCDITEDSRTVVPGSLFIARRGQKADGKHYADQAAAAGAVVILTDDPALASPRGVPVLLAADIQLASALLAETFYGNPARALQLVGITGTNGKTTTTALAWQLLNAAETRCGLIGTVQIDDGVEVAPASMTTPPAIEISRSLSRMQEAGCVACAMEVSSHALDQQRVGALRFRVAGFTNLTGDHLDYHKTMEHYAAAKARLFELVLPDGVAIVNALDPWCQRMVRECKAPVVRVGVFGPHATIPHDFDASARMLEHGLDGMRLAIALPQRLGGGNLEATVPLVGEYNACNVLFAVIAAQALGVSPVQLARRLPELIAPPGRLERITPVGSSTSGGFDVFVDYAHSDDALKNMLHAVASVHPSRRAGRTLSTSAGGLSAPGPVGGVTVVFGCGGDRDATKRPRMGKVAAELADKVIVTSDNPRTERPSDIIDQILAGVPEALRHKVSVQVDRARAIDMAITQAQPGDVVIIAGKGHETEQILPDPKHPGGTIRTHFDDRAHARAALEARGVTPLGSPRSAGPRGRGGSRARGALRA